MPGFLAPPASDANGGGGVSPAGRVASKPPPRARGLAYRAAGTVWLTSVHDLIG
jgi:hypothetical protein